MNEAISVGVLVGSISRSGGGISYADCVGLLKPHPRGLDAGGFALLIAAKMPVLLAAITSFFAAAVLNFHLTSRFAFKQEATGARFVLFFAAALVGLCVNVSVTLVGLACLDLPPVVAKIVGIGTAFILNFASNAVIVFPGKVGALETAPVEVRSKENALIAQRIQHSPFYREFQSLRRTRQGRPHHKGG